MFQTCQRLSRPSGKSYGGSLLVALVELDLDFGCACDDAEVVGETPAGIEVADEVSCADGGGNSSHVGGGRLFERVFVSALLVRKKAVLSSSVKRTEAG
jgi:hypothetical protein